MTFPKNSPFYGDRLLVDGDNNQSDHRAPVLKQSFVKTTSVPTSDIEELEHELRELSFGAESPEDARVFDELAGRVASFYKG